MFDGSKGAFGGEGGLSLVAKSHSLAMTPDCSRVAQAFPSISNPLPWTRKIEGLGSPQYAPSYENPYILSFLQNTLSEVNFPAPGGGGEPGWVRPGRSLSRRRG